MSTNNPPLRFFNIKGFTVNNGSASTTFTTINDVSVNQNYREISDSGDADQQVSFSAKGVGATHVSISLKDPIQAKALLGIANGNITFSGQQQAGDATTHDVTVAVNGFTGMTMGQRMGHNNVWSHSVSGPAVVDGATDPVTITPPTT